MTNPEINIEKLREIASKATPGEWFLWDYETSDSTCIGKVPPPADGEMDRWGNPRYADERPGGIEVLGSSEWLRASHEDIDHFIAFRPHVALALLTEIETLRANLKDAQAWMTERADPKTLRGIVDAIHDALGEHHGSDDSELPKIVGELMATIKEQEARITRLEEP
jgi:hypothetical protein